ncbi:3'(2'),5'-bisphosphate nucleotidase CysQ [Actinomarinicola tropica]|uniref:3'(2'),5'-bisphosphate nucleotidase CysQ n=1 Tax=Actinomarinicola tropica TaxID=2789776 RepID=A0A5Q2RJN6_9ACTN|nr:3'(2'),5'-bisphosphate nucleotidase CysQ [Actinomarinicola tropica]
MPSDAPSEELDDHAIAAQVATAAGELLTALRAELVDAGAPRWAIEQEGDRRAHELIMDALTELAPGDAVLSEEGRDHASRLTAERTWIVDPLDGTREYGELRHDFAVHVALVVDHAPVAGAVALPALATTLSTHPAPTLPPAPAHGPRLVVSRSRPAMICHVIADDLGGQLVPLGSAGAKAMAVVRGEAEIYAHAGGQYEWDSCAPVAVAAAAGLHVSRIDGSPLRYNRPDPWLPDLLICRPEHAERIIELVRARVGTSIEDDEAEMWA